MRRLLLLLVLALTLIGCTQPHSGTTVAINVVAGPTCPVVSDPPDPECADRPVEGAVIVVQDEDGNELGRVTTDADGAGAIELAPGAYRLVPQPVEGLMGKGQITDLTVAEGAEAEAVTIAYDTGIR
jgi:hypothetical protein